MNAKILNKDYDPIKLTVRIFTKIDKDGEYIAYCPEFKNVIAGGKTEEEAVERFKTAFKSHIETLIKYNKSINCIPENKSSKKQFIEDIEIYTNSKHPVLV